MRRKGFTLIEVAMFLAITGMIFVAVAVGTQNSIWQQRSQDSVQNFAEFLREVYSGVSNPQGKDDAGGNTEKAIYGKLIVFGETVGLDGQDIDPSINGQQIFVYDIVGNADVTDTSQELMPQLRSANINVLDNVDGRLEPYGMVREYIPRWAASIESTSLLNESNKDNLFKGSIMIVRHPRSGQIFTRYRAEQIDINRLIGKDANQVSYEKLLTGEHVIFNPVGDDGINFCVNPSGIGEANNNRYNVRIVKGAKNASGVEIVSQDARDSNDDYLNKCRHK